MHWLRYASLSKGFLFRVCPIPWYWTNDYTSFSELQFLKAFGVQGRFLILALAGASRQWLPLPLLSYVLCTRWSRRHCSSRDPSGILRD